MQCSLSNVLIPINKSNATEIWPQLTFIMKFKLQTQFDFVDKILPTFAFCTNTHGHELVHVSTFSYHLVFQTQKKHVYMHASIQRQISSGVSNRENYVMFINRMDVFFLLVSV